MKMVYLLIVFAFLLTPAFAQSNSQTLSSDKGTLDISFSTTPDNLEPGNVANLNIDFINPTTKKIQEHIDYKITVSRDSQNIFGPIPTTHTSEGSVSIPVEFPQKGQYSVLVEMQGVLFQPIPVETAIFSVLVGEPSPVIPVDNGGGCLVATAAFDSELALQVQLLREVRDDKLLGTSVGTSFMTEFNEIYYTFSPTIADWERENPVFKELVKAAITPLISSLGIMTLASEGSEFEVLALGISVIALNIGMYAGLPVFAILRLYNKKLA